MSNQSDADFSEIKRLYDDMANRIEVVCRAGAIPDKAKLEHTGFSKWDSYSSKGNHASIMQILSDSRDEKTKDVDGVILPTLVYLAREKRPQHFHNFKAGAMNALIRVSSEISNGPIILNVDCDMYSNNSNSIQTVSIPSNSSWVVKKIIGCKDLVMENSQLQGNMFNRLQSVCRNGRYQIHNMYISLLPVFPKVSWRNIMLCSNALPRHRFTVWMAAHNRLPTIERLQHFGNHIPPLCTFCKLKDEEFKHLYFECDITRGVWSRICAWLGHVRRISCWEDELSWICNKVKSKNWLKALTATAFITTVALIWRYRNLLRFEDARFDEEQCCKEIALLIHTR